jgi:hypothetical protein
MYVSQPTRVSCEEEGMAREQSRHRRVKTDTSGVPDEDRAARNEASKIIECGTVVYELFWNSGGPGAGAEYEHVFRWRNKYASQTSYSGTTGPFDDIRTAIRGAELDAVGGATVHISSTELSSEEIAKLLWDMGSEGESFRINDEVWGFNEKGRAVRRAQAESEEGI